MTAVIAIAVGLVGAGLAVSQLLRLRTYLSKPPPAPQSPPDTDAE